MNASSKPEKSDRTEVWGAGQWLPLRQHWRGEAGAEPGFHPGSARFAIEADGLRFEAELQEPSASNRARTLNEPTWRLGSICEIFVQVRPDRYLELHVTPENQRLQLDWPIGARSALSPENAWESHRVWDEAFSTSTVQLDPAQWGVQVMLPWTTLGLASGDALAAEPEARAAVCRYDASRAEPFLSSTARLTAPSYHRRAEWHRLGLPGL